MYDIKNLNIWKEEPVSRPADDPQSVNIDELSLSVRSHNCLKRAGCHTVGDILQLLKNDENGLRKIRNLGSRSESEIKEMIEDLREQYAKRPQQASTPVRRLVKPMKITMSCRVDDFILSQRTLQCLHSSGIYYVQGLYREDMDEEPGWFAVRELFDQILMRY